MKEEAGPNLLSLLIPEGTGSQVGSAHSRCPYSSSLPHTHIVRSYWLYTDATSSGYCLTEEGKYQYRKGRIWREREMVDRGKRWGTMVVEGKQKRHGGRARKLSQGGRWREVEKEGGKRME